MNTYENFNIDSIYDVDQIINLYKINYSNNQLEKCVKDLEIMI